MIGDLHIVRACACDCCAQRVQAPLDLCPYCSHWCAFGIKVDSGDWDFRLRTRLDREHAHELQSSVNSGLDANRELRDAVGNVTRYLVGQLADPEVVRAGADALRALTKLGKLIRR